MNTGTDLMGMNFVTFINQNPGKRFSSLDTLDLRAECTERRLSTLF
jgi:hypothetical protein